MTYATRYEHKVGCRCPYCRQIDRPGWYSEVGPYMKDIELRLKMRPGKEIEVDLGVNYWDEEYFES